MNSSHAGPACHVSTTSSTQRISPAEAAASDCPTTPRVSGGDTGLAGPAGSSAPLHFISGARSRGPTCRRLRPPSVTSRMTGQRGSRQHGTVLAPVELRHKQDQRRSSGASLAGQHVDSSAPRLTRPADHSSLSIPSQPQLQPGPPRHPLILNFETSFPARSLLSRCFVRQGAAASS